MMTLIAFILLLLIPTVCIAYPFYKAITLPTYDKLKDGNYVALMEELNDQLQKEKGHTLEIYFTNHLGQEQIVKEDITAVIEESVKDDIDSPWGFRSTAKIVSAKDKVDERTGFLMDFGMNLGHLFVPPHKINSIVIARLQK